MSEELSRRSQRAEGSRKDTQTISTASLALAQPQTRSSSQWKQPKPGNRKRNTHTHTKKKGFNRHFDVAVKMWSRRCLDKMAATSQDARRNFLKMKQRDKRRRFVCVIVVIGLMFTADSFGGILWRCRHERLKDCKCFFFVCFLVH